MDQKTGNNERLSVNVFSYWEGPRVPYIEACLSSVRRHCYRDCCFHHVTESNIEHYIPDGVLDPYWKSIKELGVKSDCVRAACLYLYGGLYVDADTVMLRSPVGVIDEDADCAYMTWSTAPRRCIAGYIYCRPGSPVAKKWLDNMNAKLAEKKAGWTELGERCLTPAIDSCDPGKMQILPLNTFLPIEIDIEVDRFFKEGRWEDLVTDKTIAFGLNHSWMTSRKPAEMKRWDDPRSRLLIHRILQKAIADSEYKPLVGVCTVTYKRPKLLGHLVDCFQKQYYENKFMVALDDSGEVNPASFDKCEVFAIQERCKTLGQKRNYVAEMCRQSDIICMWDDDDLWMPWSIDAIVKSMRRADWVRPSQILSRLNDGSLSRTLTHSSGCKTDKAYQGSWAMSRGAFSAVGGYPEDLSLGEDLVFAKRMRDANISECDPVAIGLDPYHIAAPYGNEHFSWTHKDYKTWPDKMKADGQREVTPCPPPFAIGKILDKVHPRPWQTNWWNDEVKS